MQPAYLIAYIPITADGRLPRYAGSWASRECLLRYRIVPGGKEAFFLVLSPGDTSYL